MRNTMTETKADTRPRWMIVDDREEILLLVREIRERFRQSVDIQCFDSPENACLAFEAGPQAFEFVITDLEMPEPCSLALCRRLRPFSPLLYIFLSLEGEILSDDEAKQKGFCNPSHRPLPFGALQEALEPAILKYLPGSACPSGGLTLVCAG
jgi:DNA-binding NtrC family response regulator